MLKERQIIWKLEGQIRELKQFNAALHTENTKLRNENDRLREDKPLLTQRKPRQCIPDYHTLEEVQVIKHTMIQNKGSQCADCKIQYSPECIAMFNFHHIIPKQKRFTFSVKILQKHTLEEIEQEANKCVLLCTNCHHLRHHSKQL